MLFLLMIINALADMLSLFMGMVLMSVNWLYIIKPTVHGNSHGYFIEIYSHEDMQEAGLNMVFV